MNHLVSVNKDRNDNIVSELLLAMKKEDINYKDSDMFVYCDFYTGDFWKKAMAKAA
ncbi:MAG: hypothetical protein R8M45_11990 [Ghiorsea sp.]